ncbi:hypothetical protein [Corynebacterium phocae]|nr:hypothetical protein [Corynebacterium phocae]
MTEQTEINRLKLKVNSLQAALWKADKWNNCLDMLYEDDYLEPSDMEQEK